MDGSINIPGDTYTHAHTYTYVCMCMLYARMCVHDSVGASISLPETHAVFANVLCAYMLYRRAPSSSLTTRKIFRAVSQRVRQKIRSFKKLASSKSAEVENQVDVEHENSENSLITKRFLINEFSRCLQCCVAVHRARRYRQENYFESYRNEFSKKFASSRGLSR